MERVLRYYEGYINKLCTRTLYDSNGFPYVCVDEYMKRRLEIKLITRTLYDSNGFPYVCVDEYMKRRLEIKLIHSIVVALE